MRYLMQNRLADHFHEQQRGLFRRPALMRQTREHHSFHKHAGFVLISQWPDQPCHCQTGFSLNTIVHSQHQISADHP